MTTKPTTTKLEAAFAALRQMPPATQDSMARAILAVANGHEPLPIGEEHLAAVLEGMAQAERGEFATEEEVADAFRRFER